MTKSQLLKTLDTLENTFSSLRGFIDDLYRQKDTLKQNQDENVKIRTQIIIGQKKVLLDLKKVKDESKLVEKRRESLKIERLDIDRMIATSDKRKEEIKEQLKKLDEKMEVSKNLTKWTEKLDDKEQILKSAEARLNIEKRDFEKEKERVKIKSAENENYRLSLGRREKKLEVRETRASNILGNV